MSKIRPPSHTPRNEPTWCDRNTMPNSIDIHCVPKKVATRLLVSGMVESHSSPSSPQITITDAGVTGRNRNPRNSTARPK